MHIVHDAVQGAFLISKYTIVWGPRRYHIFIFSKMRPGHGPGPVNPARNHGPGPATGGTNVH